MHGGVHLRALPLAALIGSLVTPAAVARADQPDLVRARALWDEAGQLERRGDFQAAAERLREAIAIRDTPQLRYALGWALEHDGRLAEARASYELAERRARGTADDVARLAHERRVALDARATPAGEARQPGASPVPIRVVEPPPRPPASDRAGGSALPWALVGTGAALAVGSVALVVASLSDTRARDVALGEWCTATACVGGREATLPETERAAALRADAERAASAGNTKQAFAAVLGGAAVVGIAAGAVLLFRRDDGARSLAVGAAPTGGGAFATGTLRF